MSRVRVIAAAVSLVALLCAIASGYLMARRLADFVERHGRVVYAFRPVADPGFEYAGRPVVFEDLPATEAEPFGALLLRYGEGEARLRVTVAPRAHAQSLPGLVRHEDWMRVLRFAPLSGRTDSEFAEGLASGEIADRIAVVARTPPPGADPETWGRIWRKDWTFDIYELLPDGAIRHERYAYPQGRPYSPDAPTEHNGLPTLRPDTWQFDAALHVMPEGSGPRIMAADSAIRAAGWTLPAASIAIFAFVAALLVAVAPERPTRKRVIDEPRPSRGG